MNVIYFTLGWYNMRIKELHNNSNDKNRICSFCGKNEKDVLHYIMGPNDVGICEDCVEVCIKILLEDGYDLVSKFSNKKETETK